MLIAQIVACLTAMHASQKTVLVAIDGGGGSGKSRLAERLWATLTGSDVPAWVVEVDDFFLPSERRPAGSPSAKPIGGDFDWLRLREQVLDPLRRGQPARYDRYDWGRDDLCEARDVTPGGVVLVEGVYSSRRELAGLYDLRIWVECPPDLRLARGLVRDGEAARRRWEEDWMPCEERYIREHRPQEYADAIFDGAAV